ncbi:family 16 glycosylhydrolase [Nocardioides sp.]|uniref:glycoside hydrolase family 16 protein n=1 Tax=Nocardioides sp. TaxID=35761 RepID=UPI00351624DC
MRVRRMWTRLTSLLATLMVVGTILVGTATSRAGAGAADAAPEATRHLPAETVAQEVRGATGDTAGAGALAAARAMGGLSARITVRGSNVLVAGRTRARAVVRVQARPRSTARWTTMRVGRADRKGAYRLSVRRPSVRSTLRVVTATGARTLGTVGPVATAAVKAPSDACGVRPRKSDGTYWACSFNDEFSGAALDSSKWTASTGLGTGFCYADSPEVVSVSGGALRLSAKPVGGSLLCPADSLGLAAPYATGTVSTFWKWSQQYGRFEVRMRNQLFSRPGLQEAFWLWPDIRYSPTDTWPASGEIDIVETYSQHPNLAIPFLHYTENDNGGPVPGLNTAWNCYASRGYWHTYTLEWTADRVTISVDGRTCLVNTAGAPSFRKPFIIALSQLMGVGANALTSPMTTPATTYVDYVRVWK